MTEIAALPDDIALRIGLAARALPDTDPARLLRVLDDAIGLPPQIAALDGLTVKGLRQAADGELADIDAAALKQALALLRGETEGDPGPLPEIEADEPDWPGSILVACASNGGELLDGHFGSCRRFLVYRVTAGAFRLIEQRDIDPAAVTAAEDKNAARAALIADCQVLCVASIGGPAAAKVVKQDIHPIRFPEIRSARERIAELARTLGTKPAPWLAKIMGQTPQQRMRFAHSGDEA